MRGLYPCKNMPNCEVEYVRVPGTHKSFCPDCAGMTVQERVRQRMIKYDTKKRQAKTGASSPVSNNERLPHNKNSRGKTTIGFFPINRLNLPITDRDFTLPSLMVSEVLEGRRDGDYDIDEAAPDMPSYPDNSVTGLHPDHDTHEATPDIPRYPYNYLPESYTTLDIPSHSYNYVSGSYAISPFNSAPGPFKQPAPNIFYSSSRNMAPAQFPMHPPSSSPPIPIDPVLLHMDIVNFHNRRDPHLQDAYVWPESPPESKMEN